MSSKKIIQTIIEKQFPDYYIPQNKLKQLGAGGQGTVYEITNRNTSEIFALKVSNQPLDIGSSKYYRAINEINFIKSKPHKHLASIVRFAEYAPKDDNSKIYLATIMPLYHHSLRDEIRNFNKSNEVELGDILLKLSSFLGIVEAIEHLHSNRVVHRDIKPENILIDLSGNYILADLGIAHFPESHLTKQNELLANRSYLSPEQKIESDSNVESPSDIYSLGLILIEIFTGKNPSGTSAKKVSDTQPCLLEIDKLANKVINASPNKRPSIESVKFELSKIINNLQEIINTTSKVFSGIANTKLSNEIIHQFINDIFIIFMYLSSPNDFENYNNNYHCNFEYILNQAPSLILLCKQVEEVCENKFDYESAGKYPDYIFFNQNGNLKEFDRLTENLKTRDTERIISTSRKMFMSLTSYHQDEVLNQLVSREFTQKFLFHLSGPPFYIAQTINEYLLDNLKVRNVFDLIEIISLNLKNTTPRSNYTGVKNFEDLFKAPDPDWLNFKELVSRIDYVRLEGERENKFTLYTSIESFNDFKSLFIKFVQNKDSSPPSYIVEDVDDIFNNVEFSDNEARVDISNGFDFRLLYRALRVIHKGYPAAKNTTPRTTENPRP